MKKSLIPFLLITSIIIINIISIIITKEIYITGIIASIFGITSVALASLGNILTYPIGLINNIAYVIIAYNSNLFATALLQGFFYIPMQCIGVFYWNRNLKKGTFIVKARKLKIKTVILLLIATILLSLLYGTILNLFNNRLPYLDASITCLSIIGMILTVKRYKEQWIFWILVNCINIFIWINSYYNGVENSILMIFTWFLYLINSIYGYINWNKLIEKN